MNFTPEKLAGLDKYAGYLEGDQLDQFMDEFEIRFGAGHWCAGEFADRFNPAGYMRALPSYIKHPPQR